MTPAETALWLQQEKALRQAWLSAIHNRAPVDDIKAAQRAYVEFMVARDRVARGEDVSGAFA